jgi:hypothetical protein
LLKTFEVARSARIASEAVEDDKSSGSPDLKGYTTLTILSTMLGQLDLAHEPELSAATRKRSAQSPLVRGISKKRKTVSVEGREIVVISSGKKSKKIEMVPLAWIH